MSKEALKDVIQRSISDVTFRTQLATDMSAALRAYDLTVDECLALGTRDATRLVSFGVDQRMSKAFTFDAGIQNTAVGAIGAELRDTALWIGEVGIYGGDPAVVQSPDAMDRNLAYAAEAVGTGGVQSPDAIDRNLELGTASVEGDLQQ